MSWIVAVSESERLQGELYATNAQSAREAFLRHGCVLLRGVFDTASVDVLQREFRERYGMYSEGEMAAQALEPAPNPVFGVGERRYEITPNMSGAFGDPRLFGNPLLRGFLHSLLGEAMRLSGLTLVVSYPGAEMQHIHRDHPLLFEDAALSLGLPPYAINVAVPLIDVDHETGPTGIWLGSNQWPEESAADPASMTVEPFRRGDCVLLDYRTVHAGVPNRGTVPRPIVYMVYARTWFFDEINHPMRPSLGMTLEEYNNLPEDVRLLALRVFSQHARARFFPEPHDG